jgi:hypothetical protein
MWLFWLYAIVAGGGFGVLVGGFEGFYNHLLKNIFYFAGAGKNTLQLMFPSPTYEMPNNFLFEATGIMQTGLGMAILYFLYKAYKQPLN